MIEALTKAYEERAKKATLHLMEDWLPYKCMHCGETSHYIDSSVTPVTELNGGHFRKTNKMEEQKWTTFPELDNITGENLVCAYCNQQLSINGNPEIQSMAPEWINKYERHDD